MANKLTRRLVMVGAVVVAGALAIAGCRKKEQPVPPPASPRAIPPDAVAAQQSFMMPIEDVFWIAGRGTVATGRIERGTVKVGDEVELVGLRRTTKTVVVVSVEMFRKLLDQAKAGDNVGLLLHGVKREEVERGQVVAKPGSIAAHTKFEASVHVLTKAEGGRQTPFFAGYRPQFFFRTVDVTGVVALPSGTTAVNPGDDVTLRVELLAPVACEDGTPFAVREGGKTVGAGIVTAILD